MPSTPSPPTADQVNAVRAFNRFYTHRAGVLSLSSDMSLTETRVLYELATNESCIASDLARSLGVDNGYLSRIIKRFDAAGWLSRTPNPRDQRQSLLSLTPLGLAAYAPVEARSQTQQTELLASLPERDRAALVQAMGTIERILAPSPPVASIRDLRIGDLGWVLQTHAELYAVEFGFVGEFEGLVAEVCVDISKMDPTCERGWMAEVDGERVGCSFLMRARQGVAKIRLVLLTSAARGYGLGNRLVEECLAYARDKGYTKVELWTHQNLTTARQLYAKHGFVHMASEPHDRFGLPLVGEMWELELAGGAEGEPPAPAANGRVDSSA